MDIITHLSKIIKVLHLAKLLLARGFTVSPCIGCCVPNNQNSDVFISFSKNYMAYEIRFCEI